MTTVAQWVYLQMKQLKLYVLLVKRLHLFHVYKARKLLISQHFNLSPLVNMGLYAYGILVGKELYILTHTEVRYTDSYLCNIELLIILIFNSAVCLFQQASSDVTVSTDGEHEAKRGFTSAVMLPSGQGLLCVTADQEFLFYSPTESPEGSFQLTLNKRLVGYNEEIVDMKFLGVEEQLLAVATSVEQASC